MRSVFKGLFVLFFGCVSLFAGNKKPDWVKKRPADKGYYIGIAFAVKKSNENYMSQAKKAALNDLAAQIKISISAKSVNKLIENNKGISESYESYLQTAIQEDLEGYELVDTWEDKSEYWVYYRLHKLKYEKMKQANIEKAVNLAKDFYQKGLDAREKDNITEALRFLGQAVKAIEKYANESLKTDFKGKKIYLLNELMTSLQNSVSLLSLTAERAEIKITPGMKNLPPLLINAKSKNNVAQALLPLYVSNSSGVEFVKDTKETDNEGNCVFMLKSVPQEMSVMPVEVRVDYYKLALAGEKELSPLARSVWESLPVIKTELTIVKKGLVAFITGQESNLGTPGSVLHVVPAVKNALVQQGFTFSDSEEGADWKILINVSTVKGAKVYNMYTAFADMDFSIVDLHTGEEIYRKSLHRIKGIQLDFNAAGMKALENCAAEAVKVYIPEIQKIVF